MHTHATDTTHTLLQTIAPNVPDDALLLITEFAKFDPFSDDW